LILAKPDCMQKIPRVHCSVKLYMRPDASLEPDWLFRPPSYVVLCLCVCGWLGGVLLQCVGREGSVELTALWLLLQLLCPGPGGGGRGGGVLVPDLPV